MGLTLEQAQRLGIGHEHPDSPECRAKRPAVAFTGPTPKRSKYRAVATTYRGVRYASKGEANRARTLDLDKRDGKVRLWLPQVKFRLGVPENVYVCDFVVVMADGSCHAEDVKGFPTPKFKRDARLWESYGEMDLWIVRNNKVSEIIVPERSDRP